MLYVHLFRPLLACSVVADAMQQCAQHAKEIDYGGWPAPRNHMSMKQGYEVKSNDADNTLLKYATTITITAQTSSLFQAKMNEHHHSNIPKGQYHTFSV